MGTRTAQDLQVMQALPLDVKILMTQARIRQWVDEYDLDGVAISFSGGKDSTVLLDIGRKMYGESLKGMFVNTGLEYPEIVAFVKTFPNIDIIKPKMNFRQVIEKYGYPFISKEVSKLVHEQQVYRSKHEDETGSCRWKKFNNLAINPKTGELSQYNIPQWKFLLDSPYKIADKCCNVMKKNPAHTYFKETGRKMITAQMACESRLRMQKWIQHGCNAFDLHNPVSNPMSFWTEQDVLEYIKVNNLSICSVYGDIVEVKTEIDGQMSLCDWDKTAEESKDLGIDKPQLRTTGCQRSGCMFCGFGCHLNNDQRFVLMKSTHPTQYQWIMKDWDKGGLGYKGIIDWLNSQGKIHINY